MRMLCKVRASRLLAIGSYGGFLEIFFVVVVIADLPLICADSMRDLFCVFVSMSVYSM